jgi:hypothetical protein
MAARRAKASMGVVTRSVTRPRLAFFTRYETLPSRRRRRRASENTGRLRYRQSRSRPTSSFAARYRAGVQVEALVRHRVGHPRRGGGGASDASRRARRRSSRAR